VAEEYLFAIRDAIINAPRSQQKSLGPSELGDPCTRRLGYKLLDHPGQVDIRVNWKATVGTGVHLWAEGAFDQYNQNHYLLLEGNERFYIETRVNVGEINGVPIAGSCDLYDRVTGTVIDHKTCKPTILDTYRRKRDPGQQYRVQAHLYGRGWQRAGLPVHRVMVAFLPRNGELDEAYIWHEAYNEQIAVDALNRLWGVKQAVDQLGTAALELLPTADAWCTHCSFFNLRSTDLTKGCPGDPASRVSRPIPTLKEALA
jgi:hypothetical protein